MSTRGGAAPAGFSNLVFPRLNAPTTSETAAQTDAAVQIREQARAEGHSAGYAAGLRAAAEEAAAQTLRIEHAQVAAAQTAQARVDYAVQLLGAAAAALDAKAAPNILEVESALIETALELTEAVIGFELADTETSARRAFERALSQADEGETRTVRMHPADVLALNSTVSGSMFGSATAALPGVELVGDPTLNRGDAVVDFSDGFLDARLASAFARAKAALTGARL
ncbi:FliH/SctL family protein [Cryobacterium melibiosiphilum]|nr:FliH/SctL family protein [Cryobacterium melibiosiphilum]